MVFSIFFKRILKYLFLFFIGVVGSMILVFILVYKGFFGEIPTKDKLQTIRSNEASLVYSSDSALIGKYFEKNRTNIARNVLPEYVKNALIATEDKRFFEHNGVDAQSYIRVFIKSILLQQSSGGGSTLTQQLAKNLFGRASHGIISLPINKIKEIIIASRLEAIYSKEELLLLYLNSVPFGENVYGIEAAANRYFNTTTNNLNIQQAAVLVGLLKATTNFNPRLYPQKSLKRRNLVLRLMQNEGYLEKQQADSLQKMPLLLNYENIEIAAPAGYFVYQVKKQTIEILKSIEQTTGVKYNIEQDGLKIYTTLNMEVQGFVTNAIEGHLKKMQPQLDAALVSLRLKNKWIQKQQKKASFSKNDLKVHAVELFDWNGATIKNINKLDSLWHYYKMLHAAVLITNPNNGSVISYVGGNNFRTLPFNLIQSHRQIASAFKPILYASAIENGISPSSYLENTEKEYPEYENWKPRNFDYQSTPNSKVAFWFALANSMNLPTVDLYFKVGSASLKNTASKLGFPEFKEESPSVSLGTLDVSLEEIVKAYGAFANNGTLNSLVMIDRITDKKGKLLYENKSISKPALFNPFTAASITAILERAINEGTGTKIRTQFGIQSDLAGKTGTAQNYSNAWFVAYTPNIVIGTWVGASTPDIHFNSSKGSGASLALPITATVLKKMEANSVLKNKYLVPFQISEEVYSHLATDPYQEKGIEGFFKRLFNFKSNKTETIENNKNSTKKKRKNR